MVSKIKYNDKYGGYDAVQYMMGSKTTELLAKSGFMDHCPTSKSMTEVGSSTGMDDRDGKCMERGWEEEGGYVSTEAAGKHRNPRKVSRMH